MRGARVVLVRIALDPDQFGRSAADIEQDGAAAFWVEQRRAADHGQRCFGLAIDHFQLDAGFLCHTVAKMFGIVGRAAGFGRDQPQPARPAVADLVAADAQSRDRALDRGLADGTGRGNALAEADDPRERIDHAEPVAGGTGDQEPAVVGAKVERGVDAVLQPRRSQPGRASAGRKAVAKPRVILHQNCLSAGLKRPAEELVFTETLAAPRACATTHHIGPCPIRRCRGGTGALSGRKPPISAQIGAFQVISMQDHTSPAALENAIALQKYGVGQPVRRKEDDTLVRGKGKYTDDFSFPDRPIAGWCAPAMPTASSRASTRRPPRRCRACSASGPARTSRPPNYNPFTCGLPLKSRDGSPLLQTNRTALPTDKVRFVGDPDRLRGRRDAGAGARRRRSGRTRHRAAARRDRCRGSRQTRRAAALRSHPQQCRARLSLWRHRQDRRRLRRRRACHKARYRQHPRRRGVDGTAGGAGGLRQGEPSATRCRCRPRASPATRRLWRRS